MNENIYSNKILLELDKLEKFSTKYKAELRLLSKKIRKDFWNNNDANLLKLLVLVNGVVNKKYLDRDVCTFELLPSTSSSASKSLILMSGGAYEMIPSASSFLSSL